MNSKLISPAAKSAPARMYNQYENVKPLADAVWAAINFLQAN
jgi:hypothetical protein